MKKKTGVHNPIAADLRTEKYKQRRVSRANTIPRCHYCNEIADPRFEREGDKIICTVCGVQVDDL